MSTAFTVIPTGDRVKHFNARYIQEQQQQKEIMRMLAFFAENIMPKVCHVSFRWCNDNNTSHFSPERKNVYFSPATMTP